MLKKYYSSFTHFWYSTAELGIRKGLYLKLDLKFINKKNSYLCVYFFIFIASLPKSKFEKSYGSNSAIEWPKWVKHEKNNVTINFDQ